MIKTFQGGGCTLKLYRTSQLKPAVELIGRQKHRLLKEGERCLYQFTTEPIRIIVELQFSNKRLFGSGAACSRRTRSGPCLGESINPAKRILLYVAVLTSCQLPFTEARRSSSAIYGYPIDLLLLSVIKTKAVVYWLFLGSLFLSFRWQDGTWTHIHGKTPDLF